MKNISLSPTLKIPTLQLSDYGANWDYDGTPTTSTAPKIDHVKITR